MATVKTGEKQFVIFKLEEEEYGIDIQKVTTIENIRPITRVPQTPTFIKGVINLRGEIIPVMDLRRRFDMPEGEYTEDTKIIIVKNEDILAGFIVDGVQEVINLNDTEIDSTNNFSEDPSLRFISGVGKIGDRIINLIRLDKLLILTN